MEKNQLTQLVHISVKYTSKSCLKTSYPVSKSLQLTVSSSKQLRNGMFQLIIMSLNN